MKNILQNKKQICFFDKKIVNKLKILATRSKNKRSRILLHTHKSSQVQEMIIVLFKGTDIPIHKHPRNKSESYFIIEGSMELCMYNKNGKIKKTINLGDYNSGKPFYYRMSRGEFWHKPVSQSKYCVYHETFSGPFKKKTDVKLSRWKK